MMRKKIRILIDLGMTLILPVMMAYSLVGERRHEFFGITMFTLFIIHHLINASWYRALLRGRYSARRLLSVVVNGLLFADMVTMMVSGMTISRYVFTALPLQRNMAIARTIHLPAAYWGFVLMSLHTGFHLTVISAYFGKISPRSRNMLKGFLAVVSVYGVYAFIKRQMAMYLFLRIHFVFFDFSEPLTLFFTDYLAVMVLFASVGYLIYGFPGKTRPGKGGK